MTMDGTTEVVLRSRMPVEEEIPEEAVGGIVITTFSVCFAFSPAGLYSDIRTAHPWML
jgi:hypothetical protein